MSRTFSDCVQVLVHNNGTLNVSFDDRCGRPLASLYLTDDGRGIGANIFAKRVVLETLLAEVSLNVSIYHFVTLTPLGGSDSLVAGHFGKAALWVLGRKRGLPMVTCATGVWCLWGYQLYFNCN